MVRLEKNEQKNVRLKRAARPIQKGSAVFGKNSGLKMLCHIILNFTSIIQT